MKKSIIQNCINHFNNGQVVLHPADTIWSLSCNPFCKNAVDKVFGIKQRASNKSFILLVSSIQMLEQYVHLKESTKSSILSFKKPTTIIYTQTKDLPDYLLRKEDKSIAIRLIQKDCFAKSLVSQWNKPIVSTSANLSGEASSNDLSDFNPNILKGVDYIVDLPQEIEENASASCILKLTNEGTFETIRA